MNVMPVSLKTGTVDGVIEQGIGSLILPQIVLESCSMSFEAA